MVSNRRGAPFYTALLLVLVIIVLSVGNYLRWWDLHFYVGPFYSHHWLSIIGASYVAIITPLFSIMKRRSP